jgi:hypothetical protein
MVNRYPYFCMLSHVSVKHSELALIENKGSPEY